MISSKILVQSATAGLVAGAVFALPWFWASYIDEQNAQIEQSRAEARAHMQPVRAAAPPPPRIEVHHVEPPRSTQARNRAAREALAEVERLEHRTGGEYGSTEQLERRMTRMFADHLARQIDGKARTRIDGTQTADTVSDSATLRVETVQFR